MGFLDEYRLVILPGNRPNPEQAADYSTAYAMWKLVWGDTFKELDKVNQVFSDDFNRQDEVVCIFKRNSCLALGCLRWVDLTYKAIQDDSYFKVWPMSALEALRSHGSNIVICSNLALHPSARGNSLGFPLKEVIAEVLVQRFMRSGADSMAATMRADKGVHRATYDLGATKIAGDITFHNVPVDLAAFFPEVIVRNPNSDIVKTVDYFIAQFASYSGTKYVKSKSAA